MFKILAIFACIAVIALAAPVSDKEPIEILKSEITKNEDGSYHTSYESADGTSRTEQATVLDAGTDDESLEIKGSYKYINDEGKEVEVSYTAGVNGFVPTGSIINPEITAVAAAAKDLPKEDIDEKSHKKPKTP